MARGEISTIRGHESALRGRISTERGAISTLRALRNASDDLPARIRRHEDEIRSIEAEIASYDAGARVRAVERELEEFDVAARVASLEQLIRDFDVAGRTAVSRAPGRRSGCRAPGPCPRERQPRARRSGRSRDLEQRRDAALARLRAALR